MTSETKPISYIGIAPKRLGNAKSEAADALDWQSLNPDAATAAAFTAEHKRLMRLYESAEGDTIERAAALSGVKALALAALSIAVNPTRKTQIVFDPEAGAYDTVKDPDGIRIKAKYHKENALQEASNLLREMSE